MFSTLQKLNNKLLPKSLPFRQKLNGVFEKLNNGILKSEARLMEDALSILNSTIPDNPSFSLDDAIMWEKRLGIVPREGVSLEDRMKAIILKLNYPITNAPRQHFKYIEDQLRAAGFNVRIYENNFGGVTRSPESVLAAVGVTFHTSSIQHGTIQHRTFSYIGAFHDSDLFHGPMTVHGARFSHLIVDHIERFKDAEFIVGPDLRSTFYVAGDTFPDFADIPANREAEFRQLLLQLKPVQTVGYLFVNYI